MNIILQVKSFFLSCYKQVLWGVYALVHYSNMMLIIDNQIEDFSDKNSIINSIFNAFFM